MEIKSVARAEGATVPTKIYSFGLTTFPPKKNQNITEKFPLKAFVVAAVLLWLANLLGAVKHALQIGTP